MKSLGFLMPLMAFIAGVYAVGCSLRHEQMLGKEALIRRLLKTEDFPDVQVIEDMYIEMYGEDSPIPRKDAFLVPRLANKVA